MCDITGIPAREIAATVGMLSRSLSIFTPSAPPSFTKRTEFLTASSMAGKQAPKGRSAKRNGRLTARRAPRQRSNSSSIVVSLGERWPTMLTPAESAINTISTAERSMISSERKSEASTAAILRPSRFICWRTGTVTFMTSNRLRSSRYRGLRGPALSIRFRRKMRAMGENFFMLDTEDARVLPDQNRMDFHLAQGPRVDFFENSLLVVRQWIGVQHAVLIGFEFLL